MEEGGILVVDDNPNNVALLGGILRGAGHKVRGATSGTEGLRIAAARAPELVLLDLQMPDLDGYEVCRRLKADATTCEIPVIVISALDDVADKVKAFEAGGVDYVTKPFQALEVLSRVKSHLEIFRLRRELQRQKDELVRQQRDLEAHNAELARKNDELVQAERRTAHVFSALAAALPGTVLDGKYRLEEKIGAGGFATVFRAEHLVLKRDVAVKVFRPWEGSDTPLALERFRREGISTSRVNHPNAVTVMDFGIASSGIAYLVMELLRGFTLAETLKERGPLGPVRCLELLAPVCDVLADAHAAGVVHRDVKPQNVFLHQTPRGEVVKVLDFGIAKLMSDVESAEGGTLTRGFLGTPAYVAPERIMGSDYDGRADVYSVGVMFYAMLSGRLPFMPARGASPMEAVWGHVTRAAQPLRELLPELPAEVEELVMQALAKDAVARPTAREMAQRLLALLPRG